MRPDWPRVNNFSSSFQDHTYISSQDQGLNQRCSCLPMPQPQPQPQPCQIQAESVIYAAVCGNKLNTLSEVRDRTHILMDNSWVLNLLNNYRNSKLTTFKNSLYYSLYFCNCVCVCVCVCVCIEVPGPGTEPTHTTAATQAVAVITLNSEPDEPQGNSLYFIF